MMDDGGALEFDEEFFMTWLLPPIIFGAAFNLNVDAFQASLFPTLLFAFLGLLCSTTVIGTFAVHRRPGWQRLCRPPTLFYGAHPPFL